MKMKLNLKILVIWNLLTKTYPKFVKPIQWNFFFSKTDKIIEKIYTDSEKSRNSFRIEKKIGHQFSYWTIIF